MCVCFFFYPFSSIHSHKEKALLRSKNRILLNRQQVSTIQIHASMIFSFFMQEMMQMLPYQHEEKFASKSHMESATVRENVHAKSSN